MLSSVTRFTRLSIALIAALAAMACVAGAANASPKKCGNKLCLQTTNEPESAFVIPDGYLIYRVEVTSRAGTSTATKVTLTFELDPRVTVVSSAGCTLPASNKITCDLGSVDPDETPLVFRFLVKVPATETAANQPLLATASLSADARQNDKGNNPNDPTNETFSAAADPVAVDRREGQSASAVPPDQTVTLDTDVDGKGVARTDKRIAKFTLFATDFLTSAAIDDDVPDNKFVCPTGLFCPTGGWTQAVIPGPGGLPGLPFPSDSSIILDMHFYRDTVPADLTEANYVLIHDTDYDPATTNYQLISARCSATQGPPCLLDVDELPNGDFHVNAKVDGNWRYR